MPDLDQIKQANRERGSGTGGRQGGFRRPAGRLAQKLRDGGFRVELAQQPMGEDLLLICCRCSKMQRIASWIVRSNATGRTAVERRSPVRQPQREHAASCP
jgi:hypothetical protein